MVVIHEFFCKMLRFLCFFLVILIIHDLVFMLKKKLIAVTLRKKIFKINLDYKRCFCLLQLANEQVKKKARPVLIKKMFVLGGLLIEQYHEQMKMTSRSKVKDKRMVTITF